MSTQGRVAKAGRRSGLTQTGMGSSAGGSGTTERPRRRGDNDDKPPVRKATGWGSPSDGGGDSGGAHVPRAGRRAGRGSAGGAGGAGSGAGAGAGGGWTMSGDSSATVSESKRPSRNRHFDDDDDGGVIQIIPDLESEEEEDLTKQVANAPRNTNRRVQTLRELDDDIKYTVPSATSGGIDLSLLTKALSPSEALQEPDKHWEFDTLLQQVAQAMQADIDKLEADIDGDS